MSEDDRAEELPDLHRAAGNGDVAKLKSLLTSAPSSSSSSFINTQAGSKKNTPLHISILFRNKEITRLLIDSGACVTHLNADSAMPISYCNDRDIFATILSFVLNYRKNSDNNKNMENIWGVVDYKGRNILHYAASIHGCDRADLISDLIFTTNSGDDLIRKDEDGATFLDIAAREGNTAVLEALKKNMDSNIHNVNADTRKTLINGHQVGVTALMHNHREFFDELLGLGKVKITLENIWLNLQEVVGSSVADRAAENSNSNVSSRGSGSGSAAHYPTIKELKKIGESLPTYVALYAEKDEVFRFLLEREVVTETQWDDEKKRTCLHWAVVHKRADIVQKLICGVKFEHLRPNPSIQDADGKTALHIAFEEKNHEVMEIMKGRASFKEYEDKLFRDREVYMQALNAVLVGSALIGSVTFAGWLQLPSDTFEVIEMKTFWGSNSVSFYSAVASMCVAIAAALPAPTKYVGAIVKQLGLALVMAAMLLAVSLTQVTMAFAGAGFAASLTIPSIHQKKYYHSIMVVTTAVAACVCAITLLRFLVQLFKCALLPRCCGHTLPLLLHSAISGSSSRHQVSARPSWGKFSIRIPSCHPHTAPAF